jgi:hypothetical protein
MLVHDWKKTSVFFVPYDAGSSDPARRLLTKPCESLFEEERDIKVFFIVEYSILIACGPLMSLKRTVTVS